MRTLFSTRKRLNDPVLKRLINYYYITASVQADKEFLLSFIDLNAVSVTSAATTSVAVSASYLASFFYYQCYIGLVVK
jgi:hypothetical protein